MAADGLVSDPLLFVILLLGKCKFIVVLSIFMFMSFG